MTQNKKDQKIEKLKIIYTQAHNNERTLTDEEAEQLLFEIEAATEQILRSNNLL